ncbi:hypothetical protein AX17_003845 [Amanita inopinata Kibby_2008]|nr:hypothetical protein AX17_003845 [Amanita inopinata Kibby_2008]
MLLGLSTGASVDNMYYPPGVTFSADVEIFGKKARLASEINKTIPGFKMNGSIEAFQFGALAVKGATGADPTLDVIIGPGAQRLYVDGEIDLFDSSISIRLLADITPKLNIAFNTTLKFTDLFDFDVHAEATDSSDSHDSDFVFSATMHQQILDYLVAHANTYMLTAKHAADDGMEKAKNTLMLAEQDYSTNLAKAQASLDEKQKAWNEHRDRDTQRSNQIKADAVQKRKQLETDIAVEKKALDDAILALEKNLENAKEKAALRIKELEKDATDAKTGADREMDTALCKLHNTQENFSHRFGDVEHQLQEAEVRLQRAQDDVAGLDHRLATIRWPMADKALISGELMTVKLAKDSALNAAKCMVANVEAILHGSQYATLKALVEAAENGLRDAQQAADKRLGEAHAALEAGKAEMEALVKDSENKLARAKVRCDQSDARDAAKKALDTFGSEEARLLANARKLLNDLATCDEGAAFQSAQAALVVAKAGMKEIEIARGALVVVEEGVDATEAVGSWMAKAGNICSIKEVKVTGSLRGIRNGRSGLSATVSGTFAGKDFAPITIDYHPEKAEEFMKELYGEFWSMAKADVHASRPTVEK